ncbi:MAG: hypothetical protein KBA66_22980 [Leptospiraceae bacterium]|nr:hypothetical protein [Leptospiraceae bacterium]
MRISLFTLLIFSLCKPADPNYRIKPLQNTEYTGFIARNFFQAVVEVPMTKEELSILEERKSCLREAMRQRDKVVIPILKQIAMENEWNERERKLEIEKSDDSEKERLRRIEFKNLPVDTGQLPPGTTSNNTTTGSTMAVTNPLPQNQNKPDDKDTISKKPKNPLLNRGEFAWFLDSMFIYKEDYSNPEKCSFVFRNIQEDLFEQVEKTKLSFVGDDKKKVKPSMSTENQTPAQTPGSTPVNTGLPQTIR